jgi:integrase
MASTHPDGLAGSFKRQVALFRRDVDGGIPLIRLHDLRHGHATTLLRQGTPVKVVVMPGMQSEAAEAFAALPS